MQLWVIGWSLKNSWIRQAETKIMEALSDDRVLDLAKSLVEIPSENPPGDEVRVAEFVQSWFEKRGIESRVIAKDRRRPNVEAFVGNPANGKRTFLMNAHMDVVPAGEGWSEGPFEPRQANGRLYGRGSADTKGGLAAMMLAIEVLKSCLPNRQEGGVLIHAVSDEEAGAAFGTKHLVESGVSADFAVVAEPTNLDVCVAHKGNITFEVTTHGKAAHASLPEKGHSAIGDMLGVIQSLQGYADIIHRRVSHHLLGSPTVNVGVISGGIKSNVIPDKCWISAERRLVPPEESEKAKKEIISVLERAHERIPGLEYEVKFINEVGASEVSTEHMGVQTMLYVLKQLGVKPSISGFMATCDAYFLNKVAKIPALIMGPGSLDKAHTVDEYVPIEQLGLAARAYALTAMRFLNAR